MGNNPVSNVDPGGGFVEEFIDGARIVARSAGRAIPTEAMRRAEAFIGPTLLKEVVVTARKEVVSEVKVISKSAVAKTASTYGVELMNNAIRYWDKKGTLKYGKGRLDLDIGAPRFNFDDKESDCVECVLAPMKDTYPDWYKQMTEKSNMKGDRNANVDVMLKGLAKKGLTPRMNDPQVGDLAFWEGHVVDIYKAHGQKFATYGASVSKGAPAIFGLDQFGQPYLTISDPLLKKLGTGKFLGFVTLKPF